MKYADLSPEKKAEYAAKQKARRDAKKAALLENKPDFEKECIKLVEENKALKARVANLEEVCKAYATRANEHDETLRKATMEYNARTQYILDTIKHAYLSAQFAMNAGKKED